MTSGDASAHLLGWLFYRHTDPLQLPLGINPALGELTSSSVVYSDSIPLFAIMFRALNPILPDNFQYFGLWILLCFALQGVFGYLVLRSLKVEALQAALGGCLLVASPFMLWRLSGHAALIGHWLLLAAVWLYLQRKVHWLAWILLLCTSVAVHAYLALMVSVVWLATLGREPKLGRTILGIISTLCSVVGWAWLLGYFSLRGAAGGQPGFGQYRTTLSSWVDSDGMWGRFLPDIADGPGNGTYEGFAYLGAGTLFLVLLTIVGVALRMLRGSSIAPVTKGYKFLLPLVLVGASFTVFALSDQVSGFGYLFFDVKMPDYLPVISNFRASGRFIWLPSYILILATIVIFTHTTPTKVAVPALVVVLALQWTDMSQAMQHFRARFVESKPAQFTAPFWDLAGSRYERIAAWPYHPFDRDVVNASFVAARNQISINQGYFARFDVRAVVQTIRNTRNELDDGKWRNDTLYVIHEALDAQWIWERLSQQSRPYLFARVDGVWVLAPDWDGCSLTCGAVETTGPIKISYPLPKDGVLRLGTDGNFEPYRRWGWSWPEDGGRWTDGRTAKLSVRLGHVSNQPVQVEVVASPFLPKGRQEQSLTIKANGQTVADFDLSTGVNKLRFVVAPKDITDAGELGIEFAVEYPGSPLDEGLFGDPRDLGVLVNSISFGPFTADE